MKILEFFRSREYKIPIPAWKSFSTASLTITQTTTYEELDVPFNAAEVTLRSAQKFRYAESDTAVGNQANEVDLQITDMDKIYIQGTAVDQVVECTWGLM